MFWKPEEPPVATGDPMTASDSSSFGAGMRFRSEEMSFQQPTAHHRERSNRESGSEARSKEDECTV